MAQDFVTDSQGNMRTQALVMETQSHWGNMGAQSLVRQTQAHDQGDRGHKMREAWGWYMLISGIQARHRRQEAQALVRGT